MARYDHVNVQAGLDAWLAEPGREHEVAGITGFRHRTFGLADLTQPSGWSHGLGLGSVTTDYAAVGAGRGHPRLRAVCASTWSPRTDGPLALLLVRGPRASTVRCESVTVERWPRGDRDRAQRRIDDIRRLAPWKRVPRPRHRIRRGGVLATTARRAAQLS
mgnify:CR=1 FL=1